MDISTRKDLAEAPATTTTLAMAKGLQNNAVSTISESFSLDAGNGFHNSAPTSTSTWNLVGPPHDTHEYHQRV